jgi:hypothetical protein
MSVGRIGEGEGWVPAVRGENLEVEKPDYIKIDVDGGELQVLMGLEGILNRAQEILIEITKDYFSIFKMMKRFRYKEIIKYQGLKTRETAYNHIFRR